MKQKLLEALIPSRRSEKALCVLVIFIMVTMLSVMFSDSSSEGIRQIREEIKNDESVRFLFGEVEAVNYAPMEAFFLCNLTQYGSPIYFFVSGNKHSGILRRVYEGTHEKGRYVFQIETKPFIYETIEPKLADSSSRSFYKNYLLSHIPSTIIYPLIILALLKVSKMYRKIPRKFLLLGKIKSFAKSLFPPLPTVLICIMLLIVNIIQIGWVLTL
ncbi:hypothetical protein [Sedimentisphaera salicampi]|uniref:hypothetical protein n=1 Tax=Sedimentisphaera salicampi TaxID=1941349 RepID=UPI000B9C5AFC|nr:hypothetical protein [Sedimentisphaera salicampi]OXU14833.1 hypothetical protein SMSP1_01328 [Sedimentisphaera salicampi]